MYDFHTYVQHAIPNYVWANVYILLTGGINQLCIPVTYNLNLMSSYSNGIHDNFYLL